MTNTTGGRVTVRGNLHLLYSAEDPYVGSLVGAAYAEAFKARSPLLVDSPEVFVKARFG